MLTPRRLLGWALALTLVLAVAPERGQAAPAIGTLGPQNKTVLASAARTASANSADLTNSNGRGVVIVIDATASADTPSVVFTVKGKDPLSGQYYTILASAAITGTSTTVLRVYPGLTAIANQTATDVVPRTYRVEAVADDADSLTYSVGALEIL